MCLPVGRRVGAREERVSEKEMFEFDCVGMILGGVRWWLCWIGANKGIEAKPLTSPLLAFVPRKTGSLALLAASSLCSSLSTYHILYHKRY
jgi:hypothetical protein